MARKAISKKLRFEVFKRDSFTCQYCGAKAPDVVLQADHVDPVAEGGETSLLNLTTSCQPCNAGKGARRLSDDSAVKKQRGQAVALQAKSEQVAMLLEWQRGLARIEDTEVRKVADFWKEAAYGFGLTDSGLLTLKKWIREYGTSEVIDAMQKSLLQYVEFEDGKPRYESVAKSFDYTGRVAKMVRVHQEKPYLKDLFYIRGILRKRLPYCNERTALRTLEYAYLQGVTIDELKDFALECRTWTGWENRVFALLGEIRA